MLIGFCGRAGAGKDTAAQRLIDVFGFHKISFADPLRASVAAMLGVELARMMDRDTKEAVDPDIGMSPRELMQKFGTEVGRSVDRDLWVKIWASRVKKHQGLYRITATDLRFRNEANAVHEMGGIVVLVRNAAAESKPCTHESEAWFDRLGHDLEIRNDGSVSDLFNKIDGQVWPMAAARVAITAKKPTMAS